MLHDHLDTIEVKQRRVYDDLLVTNDDQFEKQSDVLQLIGMETYRDNKCVHWIHWKED